MMPKPRSKNDTWSEKELAAVLKQADGHTSKSSDRGREHGSRDRRSSSSSKGQGDKEGGLGKRDSTLVTTKGESGREQKNAAAAADGSRVKASSRCRVRLLAQLKQPSTDKSPFTSHSPVRKTKERDPSKEKEKHSSSKGEGRSRGGEERQKESKQRLKDEEGRRKEGGKESHRRDQDKTRKSDKSNRSDSKPAAKGEEHLQKEDRRKDGQGARNKRRVEKERPPRHSKDASRGEPSRERVLRGAESSSEHLAVSGSEVSAGRSAKSVSGSQGKRREEELPSAGELSEGTTSDEDQVEDSFITDPDKHKQSLLGAAQPMVEVVNSEEIAEEVNYEDEEFEEYDQEDFDDEDEPGEGSPQGDSEGDTSQLEEVVDAIKAENFKISSSDWLDHPKVGNSSLDEEGGPAVVRSPQRRAFIDFSSVKQVKADAKTIRKIRRRGKELLGLIELDVTGYDMFDLAPMSEYEVYMRSFGQQDARQVAVETGEDMVDTDVQTDHIGTRDIWTQHPAEGVAVGGAKGVEEGYSDVKFTAAADSFRLARFLTTAGRVISILLEEENVITNEQGSPHTTQQGHSSLAFSTGYSKLSSTYSFLGGRCWADLFFSPVRDDVMLMMLSPSATRSWSGVSSKGILCLWDIRETTHPERLLVTEGSPTCCCLGSGRVPLAFVGMEDGSLDVWDLRESPVHGLLGAEVGWAGHLPCYSTARVLAEEGHRAAVACVTVVGLSSGRESGSTGEVTKTTTSVNNDSSVLGLSYQLASVDVSGRVVVWVVAEVTHPDPHGSETDFGLSPGGRVKLARSACVDLASPRPRSFTLTTAITTHCLAFHPQQANHYYVGTDEGVVLHCLRYGKKPRPRFYQKDPEHITDITAISFSPWQPDHFLVGCSDGIICLYHCNHGNPLLSWTRSTHGYAVRKLLWSHERPSVFVVLDDASTVHLWDLLENDAGPVNRAESTNMKVVSIALSPHSKRQRTVLVLSFEDGSVETHHLSTQYSSPREGEERDFQEYLQSLVM